MRVPVAARDDAVADEEAMMTTSDRAVRDEALFLLQRGNAHMSLDEAVADFPLDRINERPPHVSYSSWHLLEHLRLTQRDILDFIRDPTYQERSWPADYWPAPDATTDAAGWAQTLAAFRADAAALAALANDPGRDLHAAIPWGDGQILLRELLVVADHNAYHTGEFAILRQVMGPWPTSRTE
jgi:hypothetical protein